MSERDPYRPNWGNDDEHVHDANDYADADVELADEDATDKREDAK